ncbi:uncharacterized protein OCT59_027281 [Rhizophagus irregularis]|uniref:Uncharacterized protein n=3 Tax=Rhizophagus irregularis TaxID=588596 RepID=A0A915Z135_9GLOM|nr:hypothetical protein GLOIN_2v1548905 [Rhizophagus irregularis DAOM 181602=DAOM 197198]EXX51878.1 hypothetical protein RirG_257850 [Rhizophagus irregularis DAOM 197198w]UZO06977.1 hypothetical protein OCT59_027281 [Rhizophagus irregularis]POG77241.1 hypothetical protein GLOIN_2v1548905 [Rhizophagus irregularis DAOM 181602=DAOM 197198]CAB4478479.1 unnamed protein product [Rhizophagus irregularis]CAB5185977.1 unnamed protein product [Rhizophagus irregularis]|eukprot:XP_025184107.1 hypothetical protein GLOIN_2v1548905 [Rhizophagus irregularis DAOM 181602=DAOM 197198]
MVYKLFFIFINIIILSTLTYSVPYDTVENIDYDIIKGQDNEFFCPNNSNVICCPLLAHRVASENHSRCATIILVNKSGYNLTLETVNLEDGRWVTMEDYGRVIDVNCEPRSILNGESEAISTVTSHFLGGVLGFVTFIMDDDMSSKFIISWDVPTIGFPGYYFNFMDETSKHKFAINSQNTFGDTVFRIEIYEKIPWTWPTIPLYFLVPFLMLSIAIPCCCISIIFGETQYPRQEQRRSYVPQRQGQQFHNNLVNQQRRQQGRQSYNSINKQAYNFF